MYNGLAMPTQTMQAGQSANLILTLAVSLAVGLIGAGVVWARDLTVRARRIRLLDEQMKRIQFWNSWLDTVQRTKRDSEDDIDWVGDEVRRAADVVSAAFAEKLSRGEWTQSSFLRYRTNLPKWRRFFLIYRQVSVRAAYWRDMSFISPGSVALAYLLGKHGWIPTWVPHPTGHHHSHFSYLIARHIGLPVLGLCNWFLYRYMTLLVERRDLGRLNR